MYTVTDENGVMLIRPTSYDKAFNFLATSKKNGFIKKVGKNEKVLG